MRHTIILCLLLACSAMASAQPFYLNSYRASDPGTESWNNLGPSTSEYGAGSIDRGRINGIWVNPTNSNSIIACGDGGGVWKSTDGGNTWHSIIDAAGSASSSIYGLDAIVGATTVIGYGTSQCLAVDPLDTNVIYVALNNTGQYGKGGYSLGVIYTTDGGLTWQEDELLNNAVANISPAYLAPPADITKIAFMPGTAELFAIPSFSSGVYLKDTTLGWIYLNPSATLSPLVMGPDYTYCTDFGFSVQTPGNLIATVNASGDISQLWVCNVASLTWTEYNMNLDGYGYTQGYRQGPWQISMSSTDTVYMEFITTTADLLIKTPITSFSPTILNTDFPPDNVQAFAVSPANDSVIYTANYTSASPGGRFKQSTDNGHNFSEISSDEHDDGRCLYIWKAYRHPDSDIVFFGCDGGICEKKMDSTSTHSITGSGMDANEFYGMGTTEADDDIAVAGAQDNGSWSYIKSRSSQFEHQEGGDGQNSKLMQDNIGNGIGEVNNVVPTPPHIFFGWAFTSPTVSIITSEGTPGDSSSLNNRPIYYGQNDEAYTGYNHIFEQDPGYTSWRRIFTSDPIDYDPSHFFAKQVVDFYIDDANNDTTYIAYANAAPDRVDPTTNDTFGLLYYSHSATYPTPTWTNITPSIDTLYNINTISVDPANASRIWVGFGGLALTHAWYYGLGCNPAFMQNRVWYSDNAGASGSWQDISQGLPGVSVNKLLYRKGSADEIYAATDAGVYVWNPGLSSWVSFNNGLPPCVAMDLQINYCTSTLSMVTYGRGMWQTALPDVASPSPMVVGPGATTLTASALGNNNIYMQSAIDVQSGGTLYIENDTVHMPKDAVISVEPGGTLIVNNAMITNDCEGTLWEGIEARGTNGKPQVAEWQGWVTIENNSTITNAVIGVANSNESVFYNTDGGIIQCTNSTLTDNQLDADFKAYDNFHGSTLYPNLSYFQNCTFLLDNEYKGNPSFYPFQYMVSMKSVEGIDFSGCRWLNRDTVAFRGRGEGIHADNAGFNVGAICDYRILSSSSACPEPIQPRFCGFSNGIDIGGLWQMPLSVSIDMAIFDSSSVGEYVNAFNDVSTTNCTFYIGHGVAEYAVSSDPLTSCNQNVGIYNSNSQRFRMEANDFQGYPNHSISGWYNIGAAVANTGDTATNTVYRSTFDSLDAGAFSAGVNTSGIMTGDKGLQILCNTFTGNVNDIVIANDGSGAAPQGIAINQGLPAPGRPAGNTFSGSTHNIADDVTAINYYYDNSSPTTIAAEEPLLVTATLVGVRGESLAKYCPSTLTGAADPLPGDALREAAPPNAVDNGTLTAMKQTYYSNSAVLQGEYTEYNGLVDFGSTATVVAAIAASVDTAALYNYLGAGSPWLSEAALEAVATDNALPYYSTVQLLKQNPDDLRDPNFLNYMNTAYSFTTADMDTLLADANNTTGRTALEDSIGTASDSMAEMANLVMLALKTPVDTNVSVNDTTGAGICTDTTNSYYGLDSNSVYVGLDSIYAWFKNMGTPNSVYEEMGYDNFIQQYNAANALFQSINRGALSPQDKAVYTTYSTTWNVLYPDYVDSAKVYTLDSATILLLGVTGNPGFTYNNATVVAWSISLAGNPGAGVNPSLYPPGVLIPCASELILDDFAEERVRNGSAGTTPPPPIININEAGANKAFSAYPNPTSGIVTFSYNVQDGTDGLTIQVTNVVGENIATMQTASSAGSINWDPRNLASGIYLYEASDAKGIISEGKIVVMK